MARPGRPQVALVEVAVHERVGEPARVDVVPAGGEPVQQPVEADLHCLRQPTAPPGDEVGERDREGVAPPIGEAHLEQVVHAPDPRGLQVDEQIDHRQEQLSAHAVEVVAGDLGEQRAMPSTPAAITRGRPRRGEPRVRHPRARRTAALP